MKPLNLIASTLMLSVCLLPVKTIAQSQVTEGKAKVIAFDPPYNKIKVDMLDDKNAFMQELDVVEGTSFFDNKNKPYQKENLKPGSELKIAFTKAGYTRTVNTVKVTFSFVGDELKIQGILEKKAKDYAVIKGERVKLQPGVSIKGGSGFKGSWKSFDEMTLGNKMEIEGSRKDDGFIYASKAVVNQNNFSADDKEMMDVMSSQFSSTHIDTIKIPEDMAQLSNGYKYAPSGYANFGDAQYKLDTSRVLQTYVNYVGNKIVPSYIKEIPNGVPEKVNFRFMVVDNPLFNAFAMPNGMVFINSGLLAQLDNEAQLAAILGHEISHVTYKHAKERYEDQKKLKSAITSYYAGKEVLQMVKSRSVNSNVVKPTEESINIAVMMLYSGLQGDFKPVVEEAATLLPVIDKIPPESKKAVMGLLYGLRGIGSNDHARGNENDADNVGLFYMQEAGYDPREAAKVWENFSNFTLTTPNITEKIKQTANDWVVNSNMYSYQNPIKQAGDVIVSKLIGAATDNWFSSYPKASTRYRNLNQLVSSYYSKDDLTNSFVGVNEYSAIKQLATQLISTNKK